MLKNSINTDTFSPLDNSYTNKEGKYVEQYSTTVLVAIEHRLILNPVGEQSLEQMNAVLKQCSQNSQQVELQYQANGRDRFGNNSYSVFSVKPIAKKQA